MTTDIIEKLFNQNFIEILICLLVKNFVYLPKCHWTNGIERDIEKNKDFFYGIIQKYDKDSETIQIRVINKEKLENFLRKYINAYKEDKLNLMMDKPSVFDAKSEQNYESFYPYVINLFKMYEILEEYSKGEIKSLNSYKITDRKTSPVRFPEMILDLYFSPSSQEEPYIKIEKCIIKPVEKFAKYQYALRIAIKLNKNPLEIYKSLLFDYYLKQGLSKINNEFLENLTSKRKALIIQIFKAYADGAKNIDEIADRLNISRDYVKKIQDELKMKHCVDTFEQLIMKAVQENVVRFNSMF